MYIYIYKHIYIGVFAQNMRSAEGSFRILRKLDQGKRLNTIIRPRKNEFVSRAQPNDARSHSPTKHDPCHAFCIQTHSVM